MDYRTGHQIISGTKNDLTWPGRLEESAAFNREVSFYLIQLSETSWFWNLYPNTSVYSAAGYDPNGIIDYYGTLSRAGEHNVIDATAFKVRELL
jgi:hypothetical protein